MDPVPAVSVRELVPLRVLPKLILPAPAPLLRAEVPVSATALVKAMGWLLVAIVPARETEPPPLWEKAPLSKVELPIARERGPLLTIERGPELVVTTVLLIEKLVPVRLMPPSAVVVRFPAIVVVPDPVVCVIEAALIAPVEISFA